MKFHDVANIFPMMSDAEYRALVEDIKAHDQREPIWVLNGEILDGRNRWRACEEIGIDTYTREYTGDTSTEALIAFVVSLNLKRRHLNSGQLAVVALEIEKIKAVAAKDRQRIAGENFGRGQGTEDRDNSLLNDFSKLNRNANTAAVQAAEVLGTNAHYVSDAKKLADEAPDLLEKVRSGTLTLPKAMQEKKKRDAHTRIERVEQANTELPPAQRHYRVIYADPPWKYGNTMPDYFDEQAHHYTLMTVPQICELPIEALCMDDAVLFLWVTSPILAEAFDVISAWGFTYKASFVWDKIKHNMGHYNSVRHEFLLICTRGSCQPDVQKLFDSVQSIERTQHSAKPEFFREIIDTIYPHGPRIELFARQCSKGWDHYGNEISRQPEYALD